MYHPISIDGLSNAQINKLLAGHPVRVKHGKQHQIKVSAEQHKKHVKAAQKGKGVTIMLDPYQQQMHQHLKGHGIMSSLKKVAGHARTAFGHAKHAVGQASKFYGENKEVLEPYGNILKKQAHGKIEHYTEKAQPHLTKHLGEFGSHLGSHASRVAHESIQNFGELPQYELPMEPISEQSIIENELEGMGFHRKVPPRAWLSTHKGGKINVGKVLSKVGNVAVKGVSDYAKSKQGQALIQHGIKLGTDAALMSAGLPPVAGMGMHKKRGRPRKGGALYAAGYGSY